MNVQHVYPSNKTLCETAEENQTASRFNCQHDICGQSSSGHARGVAIARARHGKSLCVVSRVKGIGQNDEDIVLDQLTTDQVHLFARNIGVPNLCSKNKFACHLAIASHFEFQQQLSNFGLSPTAWVNQTTANICKVVNVIFSEQFIEDLKKVNNRKSHADHESGNTHKYFWIRAAMAYNHRLDDNVMDDEYTEHTAVAFPEDNESTMDDDFATLIVSYHDPVLAELETNEEVNLAQFEQMEMNPFRKNA